MDVKAITRFTRLSPDKARPIMRKLSGLPVAEALKITQFTPRKAGALIGKTLQSAIANAQNNADLQVDTLRVKEAVIEEGPRLKRHWPRARGSASPIKRRMCHIRIVLTNDQGGAAA